jgi:hypothetical protein
MFQMTALWAFHGTQVLFEKRTVVTMQKNVLGFKALGVFMKHFTALLLLVFALPAFAQQVEVNDSDAVNAPVQNDGGRDKAKQYFQTRKSNAPAAAADPSATPHLLALHFGGFFQGQSYKWGENDKQGAGRFNGGVTYRMGEWVNSMDLSLRAEYTSYWWNDDKNEYARKISFSPIITFPDSNSRFPLYFGAGPGIGLFMHQVADKSPVAFDWQIFGGVRVLNIFQQVGVMVEAGVKNSVLLFSEGQFNGVYINVGTVFAF